MNIEIRSSGIIITEAIRSYIEKRVKESLEKFYKGEKLNDFFISVEITKLSNSHHKGDQYNISTKISGGDNNFFVEANGGDLYAIIDSLKNKIMHTIINLHGKRESVSRRLALKFKNLFKKDN